MVEFKVSRALDLFKKGFNCAQAAFLPFAEDCGITEEDAMRIASGFGGGVSRQGEICGAASGAAMALSCAYGGGPERKEDLYARVGAFMGDFRRGSGALRCADLTGVDLGTAEGRSRFKDAGTHAKVCEPCVERAVRLLDAAMPRAGR